MGNKNKNRNSVKNKPRQKNSATTVLKYNQKKWISLALAVIFITTFIIYYNAINFNLLLAWDDYLYVTENSHIKDLNWENINRLFTHYYVNNYQPATMLFYAIEYKIGGGNASLFHFNNILLHLLNTYLVFVLIKRISPNNAMVALITAAFFAIHPMHVESVAWVAETKDVLYTFFFLLSLITYTSYLKLQKIKYLAVAFILFLLSCLSKSAAVVLPLVMLLFDYYYNRKKSWKMIIEKLPFFTATLIFGLIAIHSQKGAIQGMAPAMSVIEHIAVVSFSFLSYVVKALIPVNLSAIYPYPQVSGNSIPVIYYLSIFCVGFLLFLVWRSRKSGKDIIFGFIFFIIALILVLQFFPVGAASMADRYTYIPYIGLFFIIGKLFEYFSSNSKEAYKKYTAYLSIILVLGFIILSAISHDRVTKWENDETLFSDAKNKYPYSNIPCFVLGDYSLASYRLNIGDKIEREKYLKNAFAEYEDALKLSPNKADKLKAYYNLSTVKGYSGDLAGVINECNDALKIDEFYVDAYINRSNAKRGLKDYNGAIIDLNKAIELNPKNSLAFSNRGITKYILKNYIGAIEDFTSAINIDMNNAKSYNERGSARYMLKDYQGAFEDYNKAIELNPQYTDAIKNRTIVLSILKNSR